MPEEAQVISEVGEFRIRLCRMTDGERVPLVVDQRGLPVAMPNRWGLMRRPQVQSGTLIDEMRTVAHVHEWAYRYGIDLEDRLASGNGLRPAEINTLYQNLRYIRPLGRTLASRGLAHADKLEVIHGKTHANRVAVARAYLTWGMERTLYRLDVSDPRAVGIRERCNLLHRQSLEFQRATSEGHMRRIGLDEEKRQRLLEIIHPNYSRNPFMRSVRFRNWMLITLLLTFGLRRGESLKLYVTDINVRGRRPTLTVRRRPGDPLDTRANEPAVKTLGREVPLHASMAEILNRYVQHHRPQFPNADVSPFLLLSEEGKPLSLRSVNAILEQVVRRFPEFKGALTPHVLRYTYNDILEESGHAAGLDAEALKAARNYLNGWTLTSEQGTHYARRAIEERAREISLEHQRRLFT